MLDANFAANTKRQKLKATIENFSTSDVHTHKLWEILAGECTIYQRIGLTWFHVYTLFEVLVASLRKMQERNNKIEEGGIPPNTLPSPQNPQYPVEPQLKATSKHAPPVYIRTTDAWVVEFLCDLNISFTI